MNPRRPTTTVVRIAWVIGLMMVLLQDIGTCLAQPDASDGESSPADAGPVDFASEVRPIFATHCFGCHGPKLQESNFRLDIRQRALGSGDRGDPAIVPGNSNASPLVHLVGRVDPDDVMPPTGEGEPLSLAEVNLLRHWIQQGAPWPDELSGDGDDRLRTDHWSLQPVAHIEPPELSFRLPNGEDWVQNGIDRFILQKLLAAELQPSLPSDRVTFVRRIYLDMLGLPPTIEQVTTFVHDSAADAYERLITQVLGSTHYGERWARHWLDVVRFGESTGFEVNRDRENAFCYRDYVIEAFNNDKSYRDFITEQIAGDSVGIDVATGFLVAGPYDMVKSPDINLTQMQRQDELADIVNTTATTFLGLTIGCARCHNHKFDPILQKDFYALQAVFAGVEHGERRLREKVTDSQVAMLDAARNELQQFEQRFEQMRRQAPTQQQATNEASLPPVNACHNVEEFTSVSSKFVRFSIAATNGAEPCIDELEIYATAVGDVVPTNVALATSGGSATSSGDFPNYPIHKLRHINDGQYGNEHSWIASAASGVWVQIELAAATHIDRIVWGRDREKLFRDRLATDYTIDSSLDGINWQTIASSRQRLPIEGEEAEDTFINRLTDGDAAIARKLFDRIQRMRQAVVELQSTIPVGYVGTFKEPGQTYRLYRGDPMSPREEVAPDTLTIFDSLGLSTTSPEQERRRKLAEWIASAENPLTARVIVNRVWHYHFGQGIVATPSDFGKNGLPPTHPELLDWLASQFMQHGWSLKWLHREILSSRAYQQSNHPREEALTKDAGSQLLWRFPSRRLEAEAIRDCILHVTGKLNLKAGGPGFLLLRIDHENVHHYFPVEEFGDEEFRRMIYVTKIRQEQDSVFGIFDCPDGGQVISNRSRSTTPLQALNLMNSKFMLQQAEFLTERLQLEAGDEAPSQVRLAFQLAFARVPDGVEHEDAVEFVRQHGLPAFCRAMLNANEFLFIP